MRETLSKIIGLQQSYSSANTPEMRARGVLVRDTLPEQILNWRAPVSEALDGFGTDLDAGGRDGTGRKALIPWARLFSRRMSPSPQNGWYVVFLFHPDASGVSLCLSHGSTTFDNGEFKQKSDDEVSKLMTWAASVLAPHTPKDERIADGVRLGSHDLAEAYQRTTVYSKFYPAGALPSDSAILEDLQVFSRLLAVLYSAQEAGLEPGQPGPEVVDLLAQAQQLAAPLAPSGKGQGRTLNAAARKAIELRAMELARYWLEDNGFTFDNVSATHSCDYLATRSSQEWVVEVKGTTGAPSSILLTRNEVRLHKERYPKNVLLVVHGIHLAADGYSTSGGTLIAFEPWDIEDERLVPTCYEYRLPEN